MRIAWTKHAIKRVAERFGDRPDQPIPNALFLAIARGKPDGAEFRVRHGDVVYRLAISGDAIVILTVYSQKAFTSDKLRSGKPKQKQRRYVPDDYDAD